MLVGCSKDETPNKETDPLPESGAADGDGSTGGVGGEEIGALPGGGLIPSPEGIEKLSDSNAAPVLAERDGKFYQVYEIAKAPYTGKVVEYHPDGTESSETIYGTGVLTRHTMWHENGQKKMEAIRQAGGAMKTTHYNEEGTPVKGSMTGSAGLGSAPGRGLEWTTGAGAASIEVIYRGKGAELIKKAFGDPDENQNGVWIYKGMKITAGQTGQLMTTVRFSIVNGRVLSVSVEP